MLRLVLPQSPIIVIILVIEHIAIAKNFGKQFGYQVVPSQEIMAQATANMLGPFLGGYSCTGSFGASAVLSKAAVRTPLAGLFSALILLLALYAMTAVFYYIPRAALAGLIIHAVLNLVASPKTVMRYWQLSPFECMIWVVGVVVAMLLGLETSIYMTIGLSLLLLLVRLARTNGQILGRVPLQPGLADRSAESGQELVEKYNFTAGAETRDIYLPMKREDASNPAIAVASPYPGIFIYHFPEGLNYLNQALHLTTLSTHIFSHTKRTTSPNIRGTQDALWCDSSVALSQDTGLPTLKAIVIDCSTVNSIDITSVQGLVDLRNALDRWANPSVVDWHFGGLRNRWSRRSLATAGFGRISAKDLSSLGNWTPIYSLTTSFGGATEADISSEIMRRDRRLHAEDESNGSIHDVGFVKAGDTFSKTEPREIKTCTSASVVPMEHGKLRPIFGLDRPLFHADLAQAVSVAVANARSHVDRSA